MVEARLSQPDAANGAILDGFPRNLAQAEALDAMLAKQSAGITAAVYIELGRDQLMRRITGRRTCRNCQAVYNVESKPPKVEGVCDQCGGELVQRADDMDVEAVARRLQLYFEQTTPVVDYYRGKGLLKQVNGDQSIDAVAAAIVTALEEPAVQKEEAKAGPRAAVRKVARKALPKKVAKKAPVKKVTQKAAAKKAPARKRGQSTAKKVTAKKATRRK